MKSIKSLSAADMEKHRILIKVYQEHYPTAPEPESWTLAKDNKPTFKLDFEATGLKLKADAEKLRRLAFLIHCGAAEVRDLTPERIAMVT